MKSGFWTRGIMLHAAAAGSPVNANGVDGYDAALLSLLRGGSDVNLLVTRLGWGRW